MKRSQRIPIAILFTALVGSVGLTVRSARAADPRAGVVTDVNELLNTENMKPYRGMRVKFLDVEVQQLGPPPHSFFIGDRDDQIYVLAQNQIINMDPTDRVALTGVIVPVPAGNELTLEWRINDAMVQRVLKHGYYILADSVMPAREAFSRLEMTPK